MCRHMHMRQCRRCVGTHEDPAEHELALPIDHCYYGQERGVHRWSMAMRERRRCGTRPRRGRQAHALRPGDWGRSVFQRCILCSKFIVECGRLDCGSRPHPQNTLKFDCKSPADRAERPSWLQVNLDDARGGSCHRRQEATEPAKSQGEQAQTRHAEVS
jgi:hypothetical protein